MEGKSETRDPVVLTRIFLRDDGNIIVTDLWEAVREILEKGTFPVEVADED